MIELSETIRVPRALEEAFDYLADFRSTTEWDSTAQRAAKLTPGPVAAGTRFLINCALPLGSIDIDYEVAELARGKQIVLNGNSRLFSVRDDIAFTREGKQARIDYRASFTLSPLLAPFAGPLKPGLQRMGRASAEGLRRALEDQFPAPDDSPVERALPVRLAAFTRLGFHRASKRWNPVSASLRGRHAVITGASSGLGEVTATHLARRGAALTLVMRDAKRAERTRRAIIAETGNREVEIELADLSLLAEVDQLCQRLRERGSPVHILVNNAGALFGEYAVTGEGYERSLALLLLAPFRLTLGLKPLLQEASGARVINVVSGGMYTQKLDLQALVDTPREDYSGPVAYARAKRALMAVTGDWAEQWRGENIAVNAMHPGWVDTPGLARSLPRFHSLTRPLLRTPEQGADTIVWLAAASEANAVTGRLFLDREVQPEHLKTSTRESAGERAEMLDWLRAFDPWQERDAEAQAS